MKMIQQTPSQRLRIKLELGSPVFAAAAERLWTSPQIREIYPVYLATMHMIVRSSVPLLVAARKRARERAQYDPLSDQLVDVLTEHIHSDAGQEQWLLEELAAIGADPRIPLDAIPSPKVASLVGAQYYWVHHHHPVALLGYIAAITSAPPPPGFAEQIRERTGFPKSAFRTLTRLERQDPARRADIQALFDLLPLSRRHETLIGISALHTIDVGVDVLAEIHDRVITRPG